MTEITVADAWVQIHQRVRVRSLGIVLHVPSPANRDNAVCGTSLHRATAVTPEGAATGHCCGTCRVRAVGR